jgi:hypothetical protein
MVTMGIKAKLKGARRLKREEFEAFWMKLSSEKQLERRELIEEFHRLTPGISQDLRETVMLSLLYDLEDEDGHIIVLNDSLMKLREPFRRMCEEMRNERQGG